MKTASGKESGGVTNRLHEQFGYVYDAAGNLNYRTNNAFVQTFSVNSLNELTGAPRGGTFTVAGATTSPATNVTVNTSNAVLYADNTFASTNQGLANTPKTFTAVAKDAYGRTDTSSVTVTTPLSPVFDYDLNGNLLCERNLLGATNRLFAYDDENQLMTVWITNAWKSEFVYDGNRRRRIEKDFAWQSGTWVATNVVRFVYDDNVPIQHRDENNLPVQTLTRGRDLSGSLQGAGGIGGLLALTENSAVNPEHSFYHSDGNASVTMLIDTNQLVSRRYEYDPFGNTLSISARKSSRNRYRFSGKPYHELSGTYDFLRRRYVPELQRWLNPDPIGEEGGLNLYQFVYNNSVNWIDRNGLDVFFNEENEVGGHAWVKIGGKFPTGSEAGSMTYGEYPVGSIFGNRAGIDSPDLTHVDDDDFSYEQYKTTPEVEKDLEQWVKDNYDINNANQNKRNPIYNWGIEDCRSFRNRVREQLQQILKEKGLAHKSVRSRAAWSFDKSTGKVPKGKQ